jgi:hypothetical protein
VDFNYPGNPPFSFEAGQRPIPHAGNADFVTGETGVRGFSALEDNLNTHSPASLYEAFVPAEAKRLADRFEFPYTPKHGSWLDVAEIELSLLGRQCLSRRIDSADDLRRETKAWEAARNAAGAKVNWHFTTPGARVRLGPCAWPPAARQGPRHFSEYRLLRSGSVLPDFDDFRGPNRPWR